MKSVWILATVLSGYAFGQGLERPVLEVDGKQFTRADLEKRRPSIFFDARQKMFEAERGAVESFIGDFLLEQQAAKEGTTVAALLEKHVDGAAAKDPSEEALKVYFEGVDTNQPYEAVRPQILQAIRERRKQRAKRAYLDQLRANAKVKVLLDAPRMQPTMTSTPVRGPKDAPVLLVEYADYECPYCQQVEPVLQRLRTEYAGKLAIAYKDVPLPMHPHAQKAAEASRCAEEQGKYWEFHDILYTSRKLDTPDLAQHAKSLNLDAGKFGECLSKGTYATQVKSDLTEFEGNGLQGTPSFLLNGKMVSGVLSFEQFKAMIDEELAAKR